MTFSSPRFSPWQQAAITAVKKGGDTQDAAWIIKGIYPEYTMLRAWQAAENAIAMLERKGIVYRDGGTLRLVTTEKPNELTAP